MNRVGQLRMALPSLVSYPHAYRDGGLGLLWETTVHQLVEPNADERERVMRYMTGLAEQCRLRVDLVIATPLVSSLSIETVLAMAGGDRQDICQPWNSWDEMRGLARVAAHAVGDDSHVEVATKKSTENPSLQDVA
ncbi:hypothetical protein AXG93_1614s1010 [Marchantia polymorpha subsp. ruderalis]|uniref:Uncharacterized protein n=1 Tax=Marchantia polymorpha subsp. ruderalis TaxID=1480154 RepID=A0A176W898_MARPO|nr:hypothetical protein AXG93_1614s1010 [Marchantia polymorpha subsp. ruderalis]